MADSTCTFKIDMDEPISPENTCGMPVNIETIETSVPGSKPATLYICPKCDLKEGSMEQIEADGWMATVLDEDAFDEPEEDDEEPTEDA